MDSMFVISCCDWILAEFIRLYHTLDPYEAQHIVDTIVERKAPLIEETGSGLLVLNPDFSLLEEIILLLYHKSSNYVEYSDLAQWIPNSTLESVIDGARFLFSLRLVHSTSSGARITRTGIKLVEDDFPQDICLLLPDFKSFALSKGVSNHDDIALLAVYWRSEKLNETSIDSEILSQVYPVGRFSVPQNLGQHLSRNVQMGYLERISKGIFSLTEAGSLNVRKRHIFGN
jgi:hypothetical protein